MTGRDEARGAHARDARSLALADYLRRSAAAFSLSADVTDAASTAEAGMALLDAAAIAEFLPGEDGRIRAMSEAGLFESMPVGRAVFVEVPEIRAAVLRALVSGVQDGTAIVDGLAATAATLPNPNRDRRR